MTRVQSELKRNSKQTVLIHTVLLTLLIHYTVSDVISEACFNTPTLTVGGSVVVFKRVTCHCVTVCA